MVPRFLGICTECACVVECEESEIRQDSDSDFGDGVRYHVECPNVRCRHDIDLQKIMRPVQ